MTTHLLLLLFAATQEATWAIASDNELCVDAQKLAAEVKARVSPIRMSTVDQADRVIRIRTAATPNGGYRSTLHLADLLGKELGLREVQSDDCSSLQTTLALVAGLMISKEARAAPADARRVPLFPIQQQATPQRAENATSLLEVSLSAAIAHGPVPTGTAGVRLGIWISPPSIWPFELAGTAWPTARLTEDTWTSATLGSFLTCPLHWKAGPLQGWMCGGPQAGVVDVRDPKQTFSTQPLLDLQTRAPVQLRLDDNVFLQAGLVLGVPMVAPANRFPVHLSFDAGVSVVFF